MKKMASRKSVPILDMEDLEGLPDKIVRACEEFGCFRLKNHGLPPSLMSDMKAVARSLLERPLEVKMRNFNSIEPSRGYIPPNIINPFFESLCLYDIASCVALEDFCTQMEASSYQREIIYKFTSSLNNLVEVMGKKLVEGLGFAGDEFRGGICQMKMNNYRYGPETVGLNGGVLHSDVGLFTILQDDEDVNGLEALDNATGQLISLDPVPGTLVFNVGDAGKVWSNGRLCNVKHQVHCYKAKVRMTIAVFVLPREGEKVEVLADSEHPPVYVPLDFEQYVKLRSTTKSITGEALDFFRSHQDQLLH